MQKRIATYFLWTLFTLSFTAGNAVALPGDILSTLTINNVSGDGRVPTNPHGIAIHDGYIWVLDWPTDRIYRVYPDDVYDVDGFTLLFSAGDSDFNIPVPDTDDPPINSDGTPIGSCASATPAGQYCGGGGLTFAENFLWNASPITDDIIKIDPVDGDNLESENALAALAFPSPTDMTFDGTYFWIADWQSNTITKVLPEDGSVVESIPGPSSLPAYAVNPSVTNANIFGLTWDGQALWATDTEEDKIYRISPVDGSLLNEFASPGSNPKGLAWDGESLWHVDQATATIYRIESGVIPFGIVGCIEKNGVAVGGDVLLSQTALSDQATTTDLDGCFSFANFESGNPIQVKVSETGVDEKPVITLVGGDVILIVGDTFSEPGVTADDTEDGDISANVVAVPDVIDTPSLIDTSAPNPGGQVVTYNVIDSAGNAADPVTRTVYVLEVDAAPPVITLIGDNPMYVEQGTTYTEPGATALDDRDGDITGNILVTGTVNAAVAGNYAISYDVADATGNNAVTVTRNVIVQDTTIPVITLLGANPITHERGDTYTDPGASATDNIDGGITGSIVTGGSVSQNTLGSYVLTYDVSDIAGNAATTVTRTINVVDTTVPVITLLGTTPLPHELNTTYTDPGATASDYPGDDLTSSIASTGTVNSAVVGTYTLSYNVTDIAGNVAATVTRDVVVSDTGTPTINLVGDNPLNHEQGTPYTEPGYSATDAIDDDATLSASVLVGGDTVDANTAGTYNVTYDVTDSAGNPAPQVVRTVVVADTTPPVITLTGPANINHELQTTYTDAGATASDSIDPTVNVTMTGAVDINTTGSYLLTYNATDSSGNAAAPITRLVDVADRTAPVITLNGANPLDHEVDTIFVDPGAFATDAIDDNATLTAAIGVSGSVDAATQGTYTLTYNLSDSAGNAASTVTRTVNVVDTGAPTIALNGDNPVLHEIQTAYVDAGATASDAADGPLGSVTAVGTVDVNVAGTYTLTYDINDSQGNPATTVTRDVIVADRTPPVITLTGSTTVNHEQGTTYTDAGASASDVYDGPLGAVTPTGSVNDTVAGTYVLSYDISDAAGNAATTVTRTVIVADTIAPVITLSGANPLDHEVDTIFVDPGASATDAIDDNATLTAAIGVTGSVNASTQGTYTLTYNVSDSSGNAATTVTRTVNVVDTGAPSITLLGNNPVLHEQGTPYTDAGATASDAADGPLGSVPAVGTVDVNTPATYALTYDITDSQGNPAPTVTRNVIVADRTAPVITITGSTTVNHEQGTVYTDAGATASDNIDGPVTVITTNPVNSTVPGSYTVSYNVSDAAGNAATTVTRTVIVGDSIPPVITLVGANPIDHEVNTVYTDPGATANDNINGNISGSINVTGSVNASVVGSYSLTYNVIDSAGNAATPIIRTVNVADTGAPVISITGANPLNHEINTAYVDPGATASDAAEGDLTSSIVTVNNVNSSVAGTYTVTYDVSDSESNPAAQQVRTVNVGDYTAPVITLLGASTVNVEQGTSYTDAGATANDNVDGNLNSSIIASGTVAPSTAGTYILSYNVSDSAGNAAIQVNRTVIVADTIAPVITLIGSSTINHEQGTAFSDPGASASDSFDGNISTDIVVTGSVNVNVAGTYTLSYNVSDAAGNNASTITRDVIVADTIAPTLTLIGSTPLNHDQGTAYNDPGASANDSFEGNISGSIAVTGAVNVNVAGTYTLTYNVSDTAGNAATSITRDVVVADLTAPVISLTGSSTINHEQGTVYADAGATATDTLDGNLTTSIVTVNNVNSAVAGIYTVTYDVQDAAGNNATQVVRTVTVADTIIPVITLSGDTTMDLTNGTIFVDPGFGANDNIDGEISGSVVRTGTIDINTDGTYVLSYDVTDAGGNAATTQTRTVNVVTPATVTIGAETASIGGLHTVSTTHSGFTPPGYIEHSGEGYIEYTFDAFAVPYDLTVRYSQDIGDRPLEVILNGISLNNLNFPATGSMTTWLTTAAFPLTPQSGTNTLRLSTDGSSGANIDQLVLTPQ